MIDERMSAELADDLAASDRRIVDPRSLPVRFSRLRAFGRSALHYLASCQDDDKDTPARKLGRGAHALALGTPVAVWGEKTDSGRARPRNGKDWDAFKAKHAGAEILNAKEYAQCRALADALQRHKRAADMLYTGGTKLEHEVKWSFLGRECLSHIDAHRPGQFVIDLKFVRDASLERFGRVAIWSDYHAQVDYYRAASEALGHPTPDGYLFAIENTAPYDVTVRPLTVAAMEAGRRRWQAWFGELLACEKAGVWPGYAQSDVPIDVVGDDGPLGLMFGGEDVSL